MEKRRVECVDATKDNFAPYGQLVSSDGGKANYESKEFNYWHALGSAKIDGRTAVSMVEFYGFKPLVETALEQHVNTAETLVPTTSDIVIVVAKSDKKNSRLPDPATIAVFRVKAGDAVVFEKNVWHHAPMTYAKSAKTFVIFDADTPDKDCFVVDLAKELGFVVEVA